MKRAALLGLLAILATACSGSHSRTLGGQGISLSLPHGWYGVSGPGQLQAADFPLARSVLASEERARVRRGHVHVIVWDGGPAMPLLARNHPRLRGSLRLIPKDLASSSFEGFPLDHVIAQRPVTIGEEFLDVLVDLGPKPVAAGRLRDANRVLATLKVAPPRVLRPRGHVLATDGVSLRLLPEWSGRIEVPVSPFAARFVLRARRGSTRVTLLELPPYFPEKQVQLPIAAVQFSPHLARRVVMVNGHSFDLSVAFAAPDDLVRANRLLAGLTVQPRAWTFSSCQFTLRLPGPWTAGVRRRGGCYLTVTLRARGLRVVLEELRPGEHTTGRVIRRSGRRFQVQVTPSSAADEVDPVLATLRAKVRSAVSR